MHLLRTMRREGTQLRSVTRLGGVHLLRTVRRVGMYL